MEERWAAVDRYIDSLFVPADEALDAGLRASRAAGLPDIQVSPAQGKLLHLLARAVRARRILELGTLGGYSTMWLARAVEPGGRVVTLEVNGKHAEVARSSLTAAGLDAVVDLRLGPALQTLPALAQEQAPPFDFIFIDADKPNIPEYFDWAVRLSRPGAVIVVDNVVREGEVVDAASADPSVQGVRRFNAMAAADGRVSMTTIQTVGSKGYDGFAFALVIGV